MSINKDYSLLNNKVVYDLTPFSHLDYPNHLSCIVWISGCNLRCDYCYNKDIVFAKNGKLSFNDILLFLDSRINLLDAIVLSGGEATGVDLIPFCIEVKKRGFKIKLDTNGINYTQIKQLVDLDLIDFIALDYKAPNYKFKTITHSSNLKFDDFEKTLQYLIDINFDFEVRTTVHTELLDENDINMIIKDLENKGYKYDYFLQNFLETDINIGNIKISNKVINLENIQQNNGSINIKFRNY